VVASCLVHDLHRVMSNEQKRYVSPGESLERIEEILRDVGLSYEQIEKVVFAVFHHEDKFLKEELSVEAEILQDADALDALGEQGLKRALKFGKAKNLPVCKKDLPLLSSEFVPDINPISTVHYVFRVMIMQAENLFSKTAKKLAKSQVSILEDFVLKHMNN
ncbi:MAG: HD domain-containing protein, partial [Clostridia bacterium]